MSHHHWRPRLGRNGIVLLLVVVLVIEPTEFEDEEENEAKGILLMQTKRPRL
jgi:hypothetical protein